MIRLLWLLGALALAIPAVADDPPPGAATTAQAPSGARAEPATPAAPSRRPAAHGSAARRPGKEPGEPGLKERAAAVVAEFQPFLVPSLGALGGLLVAGALVYWRRKVAVHRLPEFAVEPRLGGSHGAGIGGVISFADPSQPPSSQHRLRPDSFSLP